jgi:hypothetical protein
VIITGFSAATSGVILMFWEVAKAKIIFRNPAIS